MSAMMPLKSYSGESPLKSETKKSISSSYYSSSLHERPEERVRLLDQLNDKPLSFYREKREEIYISDFMHNIVTRIYYGEIDRISNAFFQNFQNFYSSDEIILPLPTPNRVNLLRYEMHPIGKKYTDKPNNSAILAFGNKKVLLLDRIGGLIILRDIPPDLQGLNLKIAEVLNRTLISVGREIDVLSIRYRPHPFADVYDDHTVIA